MKTLFRIFPPLLLFVTAQAQLPSNSPVSMEVTETATENSSSTNFEIDSGNYDRDNTRSKTYRIDLKNFGHTDVKCVLEFYFIVKKLDSNERYIFRAADIDEVIKSGQSISKQLDSGAVKSNTSNLDLIGSRTTSGAKPDGWIAVLSCDGHQVEARGSTPTLQKIASDKDQLDEIVADYVKWEKSQEK